MVVGVERTPERRVFLVPVAITDAETLTEIIQDHVLPGSVVHTDGWRAYSAIESRLGLTHQVVNHSLGYKDAQTGVHTNTVEGTNFALKRNIPIRCRVEQWIEGHLLVFI